MSEENGSQVYWTAESSTHCQHRGSNDYEVLKVKDYQVPLKANSKTFKAIFCFQGLCQVTKNRTFFQGLSMPCGQTDDR